MPENGALMKPVTVGRQMCMPPSMGRYTVNVAYFVLPAEVACIGICCELSRRHECLPAQHHVGTAGTKLCQSHCCMEGVSGRNS